jgi:hypothetical protein
MRRFLTRNFTKLGFAFLFVLVFLIFKNHKSSHVAEKAEEQFKREPGTASEEKERDDRRISLSNVFFEGIAPPNANNIYFLLGTTMEEAHLPRYVSYRQVCAIESARKKCYLS